MAVSEAESTSSSILCSCCRFGSSKKKSNYQNRGFDGCQPTLDSASSADPTSATELMPKIVMAHPQTFEPSMETTREDVFTTARTSRVEEAQKYTSMSELVRKIRSEAGFEDTPRIPEESDGGVVISQLRIEGLAEIERNQDVPLPLPSVSAEYSTESAVVQFPDAETVANYRPSMQRRIGQMTFLAVNTFWKTYSIVITFIALIFERILPV